MKKTKRAFTLAESLIVIAIIAIASILTIPIIIDNSHRTQYITNAKKAFSSLSKAFDYAYEDNYCIGNPANGSELAEDYENPCIEAGSEYILNTLQSVVEKVFIRAFATIDKDVSATTAYYITRDGQKFVFSDFNADCGFADDRYGGPGTKNLSATTACAKITVDTNANQAPNELTVIENDTVKIFADRFEFYLYKDGVYCLPGQNITTVKTN